MQRPVPAQAAAPLSVIQCSQHHGRRPPYGAQAAVVDATGSGGDRTRWRNGARDTDPDAHPGLIWLTDPGSTIEMALTTTRGRSSDGGTGVIVVAGELDAASVPRLRAFIDGIYFPYETVRLDLGSTGFADGALLRVLDAERALRAPHRAGVEIIRASPAVRRILEITGELHYLSGR